MAQGTQENGNSRGALRGWAILLGMILAYVIWVLLIYLLVGEREPGWQYGAKPDVPGESWFSIERAPGGLSPKQLSPSPPPTAGGLPGVKP